MPKKVKPSKELIEAVLSVMGEEEERWDYLGDRDLSPEVEDLTDPPKNVDIDFLFNEPEVQKELKLFLRGVIHGLQIHYDEK
jgi:hypothetical protein